MTYMFLLNCALKLVEEIILGILWLGKYCKFGIRDECVLVTLAVKV